MCAEGLKSLFPLEDLAVMGFLPVLARLPRLFRRVEEAIAAVLAARPDVLVIIDSPDFTHRVTRQVRKRILSCRFRQADGEWARRLSCSFRRAYGPAR